jgi:3'(2'), 5'-bisphosphate nucleotidase
MVDQTITGPTGDQRVDLLLAAALEGARALAGADRKAVLRKADGTPQTAADLASDAAIRAALHILMPGVAIVSEEHLAELPPDFAEKPFLLVDPLDGTREFMQGHPDHAVCIALIEGRRPVAGVVVAPMRRTAWTAGGSAMEWSLSEELEPAGAGRPVKIAPHSGRPGVLATSRSRPDPFAAALRPSWPDAAVQPIGAVLKLVAVATGAACLFPAGNPSSEWDIAAGEALVLAAGGAMLAVDGRPIRYGNATGNFSHPPYAAGATEEMVRTALAQWPAS